MGRGDSGPRLVIVCGLPGSGKTTFSRMLERRLQAVRFCPDDWLDTLSINLHRDETREKVKALQWRLIQNLLALGLTVIIEWGTWARSERDALRLGARAPGAGVELHYLSAPIDVLLDRIKRRGRENPAIERDAVYGWVEMFEVPTSEETALLDKPLVSDLAFASN
jgi:predicted kinase